MPTDSGVLNNEYTEVLNEICNICIESEVNQIVIGGDFNTDFSRNNPQSKALNEFCNIENFSKCLNLKDADIPYTFCSKQCNTYSTIDHFFVTNNLENSCISYQTVFNPNNFLTTFQLS